jgi:peptide/nickel transport system ATP-binding protein
VLRVRDLNIAFRTKNGVTNAVENLSFDVEAREILGLVGESGSGKTLSMLACLGLINDPNAIITGRAEFRGQNLIGMNDRDLQKIRGRHIAMIFQDPMSALHPLYTIGWQIIEQIRTHLPCSAQTARGRAIDLLKLTGIPDPDRAVDRYPHQLSGGMRQRAMIAMALSCNPALLIADEATTALDVTVQAQILALLRQLRHQVDTSIIVITHDMGVVSEITDRVMVMYAGRIAERAQSRSLFANPAHPYTRGLLASIPPLSGPRLSRLPSIPGTPPNPGSIPPGCAFAPRCAYRIESCEKQQNLQNYGARDVACHRVQALGFIA